MGTLTRLDLGKVSLNNQYQVHIAGISFELKRYLQQYYDIPNDYATGNKEAFPYGPQWNPTKLFIDGLAYFNLVTNRKRYNIKTK